MRRRDFLKVGAVAAVAAAIPLRAAAQEAPPTSVPKIPESEIYEMMLELDPSRSREAIDGKELRVKWNLWVGREKEEFCDCGDQVVAPSPDGRYRLKLRHPLPTKSLHVFQWEVFGLDGTPHILPAVVSTPGVLRTKR